MPGINAKPMPDVGLNRIVENMTADTAPEAPSER